LEAGGDSVREAVRKAARKAEAARGGAERHRDFFEAVRVEGKAKVRRYGQRTMRST
jgi:hypothetical protein